MKPFHFDKTLHFARPIDIMFFLLRFLTTQMWNGKLKYNQTIALIHKNKQFHSDLDEKLASNDINRSILRLALNI